MEQQQYTQGLRLLSTRAPHVKRVALDLDCQTRFIGKLDEAGEGTFISAKRTEKHLFRKLEALGVNLDLLRLFPFRWVLVPFCGRDLWTSKRYLLDHGTVFSFKRAGFETQAFLPLNLWGLERAREYEAGLGVQGDLFRKAA